MPTKVAELEISEPIKALKRIEFQHYDVKLLVRLRGEPLGWLDFRNDQLPISAEYLREIVATYYSWAIYEHSLRLTLDSGQGLNSGKQVLDTAFYHLEVTPLYPFATALLMLPLRYDIRQVEKSLAALKMQSYGDYRILMGCPVSDDAPLTGLAEKMGVRLFLGEQAFYQAVSTTKSEFIAILGQTVVPDKGWLKALAKMYDNPKVAGVVGALFPSDMETAAQLEFGHKVVRNTGFLRYYSYDQVYSISPESFGMPGNASFRVNAILKQLNQSLFKGEFGITQMLYLYYELLKEGYMIGFEPQALGWERYPTDVKQARRQLKQEVAERFNFLSKFARSEISPTQIFRRKAKFTLKSNPYSAWMIRKLKTGLRG